MYQSKCIVYNRYPNSKTKEKFLKQNENMKISSIQTVLSFRYTKITKLYGVLLVKKYQNSEANKCDCKKNSFSAFDRSD